MYLVTAVTLGKILLAGCYNGHFLALMVFEWSSLRSKPGNPTGHPRWPPGYKYKI
jgi:hypothetical protein